MATQQRREKGILVLPDGRCRASWMYEGRWVRKICRNRTEARALLQSVRGQIIDDHFRDRRKEVHTSFEQAVKRFLEWSEANCRASTFKMDRWVADSWKASPCFKGRTLDKITGGDVERYKIERMKEAARDTKSKAGEKEGAAPRLVGKRCVDISLARLKRLFTLAGQWGLVDGNPAAKVKLFREDPRRVRFLTDDEEERLLKKCSPYLRRIVLFALHTGTRRGEILGLTWRDVDLPNAVATIPATRAKGKKDRHVFLNEVALSVLHELPRPINTGALVFPNGDGGTQANLSRQWRAAITAAKIEDFRFHDLRHTFASRAIMAGADLAVVRELLGHRDFETTLRYAHLAPKMLMDAVAVLAVRHSQKTNIGNSEGG